VTWFRIDDGFYDHPKLLELEDGKLFAPAVALWTLAGCWCSRQLTDGHVPTRQVRKLGFAPKHAAALVSAGLWVESDGGWQFHDWTAHQPTREDVESKREADRIRKAEARARGAESRRRPQSVRPDNPPDSATPSVLPDPTRPDPTRPRDTSVSPPRASSEPEAWVQVGKLYAERYTAQTTRPVALQIHRKAFEAIAVQAVGNLDDVRRSLDGFWQDEWASANGWPPGAWAKQFGRHLDGPADPVAEEAKRRADRKAQIARIDAEILGVGK
jgi:hypothetical protein